MLLKVTPTQFLFSIVLYKLRFLGITFWRAKRVKWWISQLAVLPKLPRDACSNIYWTMKKRLHAQAFGFEFSWCAFCSKLLISWNHLIIMSFENSLWDLRLEFIDITCLRDKLFKLKFPSPLMTRITSTLNAARYLSGNSVLAFVYC